MGEDAKEELANRLSDPDSAVRFWAVTAFLLPWRGTYDDRAASALLDDPSISISLAAGDYLVRAGEGALALPAFARALASDILWARIRAGAYLSYRNRQELQPMKPLIPALEQAMNKQECSGRNMTRISKRTSTTACSMGSGMASAGVGIGAGDKED